MQNQAPVYFCPWVSDTHHQWVYMVVPSAMGPGTPWGVGFIYLTLRHTWRDSSLEDERVEKRTRSVNAHFLLVSLHFQNERNMNTMQYIFCC